ncbi:MAG: ricin-type beta-trefoil lectin domain protein [Propionibacteriaceae bacterium]|nr:ricin-type beta-trefoil lectin domain protein [Propionibacteriaceae bacterium]
MRTAPKWLGRVVPLLAATALLTASAATPAQAKADPAFDDTYFVMQHNTYDAGDSLTGWLDSGFRSVELDVIDRGDWAANPAGPYISHNGTTGDFNCSGNPDRLGDCLNDLAGWQANHPGSGPLLVFVDLKPSWNPAFAWGAEDFEKLDRKIAEILGERLFPADELYRFAAREPYSKGGTPLRKAVADSGWPTLSQIGDRMVVAYTGSKFGSLTNKAQSKGLDRILAQGKLPAGFFCPDASKDPNELDPWDTMKGMSETASEQVVCSNIESRDHYEKVAERAADLNQLTHLYGGHVFGNESYTYNYIAISHGITAIGRDATGPEDTFGGKFPLVGVSRSVPGQFQVQTSKLTKKCMAVEKAGTKKGAKLISEKCSKADAQRFVYTAEGQLRPKHAEKMCVDINGSKAKAGAKIELGRCDGGATEKWQITADGKFQSYANPSFCLAKPALLGSQLSVEKCRDLPTQRFDLKAVPNWVR